MSASSVASLLAALAIIITAARLLGALARRVGQPAVVGEILAGVILGPTFFGAGLADRIFPLVDVRPALSGIGDLGLALFMFIVGYELDHTLIRSGGRASTTISLASIAAPLGLGIAVGWWLARQQHVGSTLPFALFIGVATAITAFPVLARILTDRGMQRTAIGGLALTSAAINDVCAWTLLAIVLGIGWELGYHLLMQFRWEKDWPSLFGLLTGVPEGLLIFLLLVVHAIPGIAARPPGAAYVIDFGVVWLVVWLVANGPMRVPFLRWRFRGGRLV